MGRNVDGCNKSPCCQWKWRGKFYHLTRRCIKIQQRQNAGGWSLVCGEQGVATPHSTKRNWIINSVLPWHLPLAVGTSYLYLVQFVSQMISVSNVKVWAWQLLKVLMFQTTITIKLSEYNAIELTDYTSLPSSYQILHPRWWGWHGGNYKYVDCCLMSRRSSH